MKIRNIKVWLPVILLIGFIGFSCKSIVKELVRTSEGIYLLKQGFTGPIVILFEQPDGITPGNENGITVYKIPQDGLLKVKTSADPGSEGLQFYYESAEGERKRIEFLYTRLQGETIPGISKTYDDVPPGDQTIYVMDLQMGSFNAGGSTVRFKEFKIGRRSDGERLFQETREKITKVQKDLSP